LKARCVRRPWRTGLIGISEAGATNLAALDGKWLTVYVEEGGRRNNAWEQRQATASDSRGGSGAGPAPGLRAMAIRGASALC
jgi:hypothetical protein